MQNYLRVIVQLDAKQPDQLLLNHPLMLDKSIQSFDQFETLGAEQQQLPQIPYFPVTNPATAHHLLCFTSGIF